MKGNDILFDKISVIGIENVFMVVSFVKGIMCIINVVKELEIV